MFCWFSAWRCWCVTFPYLLREETFYIARYRSTGSPSFTESRSVCRSIIESHRGRLWATPNDGPGATFSFSVPCAAEDVTGTNRIPKDGTPAGTVALQGKLWKSDDHLCRLPMATFRCESSCPTCGVNSAIRPESFRWRKSSSRPIESTRPNAQAWTSPLRPRADLNLNGS